METDQILEKIIEVSAELIEPRWRSLTATQVIEKTPGDLVTVADREAEAALTKILQQSIPGCLVVGEEATFATPSLVDGLMQADVGFVIDPIDGTKNFVAGKEEYAVMVAETRKGKTVRSWIYQPAFSNSYVAELGSGTFKNGQKLTVRSTVDRRLVGVLTAEELVGLTTEKLAPVRMSKKCAGVDYPDICEQKTDFVCYRSVKPWDHLPGVLLVRETGGESQLADGTRYDGNLSGDWVLSVGVEEMLDTAKTELTRLWH